MKTTQRFSLCGLLALFILIFFAAMPSFAQKALDSLVLKNGDIMVGEIKSLDKGVVTVETNYSEKDFLIEWSGVKEVFCKTRFLITLRYGDRINGTFFTKEKGKILVITGTENHKDTTSFIRETRLADVVYLKGLKSDFWSRMHASIDVGLNITRTNNLRQFSSNTKL